MEEFGDASLGYYESFPINTVNTFRVRVNVEADWEGVGNRQALKKSWGSTRNLESGNITGKLDLKSSPSVGMVMNCACSVSPGTAAAARSRGQAVGYLVCKM